MTTKTDEINLYLTLEITGLGLLGWLISLVEHYV